MQIESEFSPPPGLGNAHVQTILGSSTLRSALIRSSSTAFLSASTERIISCSDGVRLHGISTPARSESQGLVILIHGWHGHADSSYLLETANHLWLNGFSVFRLHLRDHGPSHHLNRELFHSVRIMEVVEAVAQIVAEHPLQRHFLAGFSLGGNFALRVGLRATNHAIDLDRIVAVCPVLDPRTTMDLLSESLIYHQYFIRKWRSALLEKLAHYPDYDYRAALEGMRSMREMNAFFVPRYTGFADTHSYLSAYALTGDQLSTLDVPSHLIIAADDPVIPAADLARITQPPNMTVELSAHGGHCAFLDRFSLRSWIPDRVLALLNH